MPPGSYVDWGAVHFYTPLNRTGEQILTDEEKSKGRVAVNATVVSRRFLGVKMRAILGKKTAGAIWCLPSFSLIQPCDKTKQYN